MRLAGNEEEALNMLFEVCMCVSTNSHYYSGTGKTRNFCTPLSGLNCSGNNAHVCCFSCSTPLTACLLLQGDMNRKIAEHALNTHSSRSHCIFTIHVEVSVTSLPLSQLFHSLSPPSLSPSCHTRSPLPPSLPAVTLALPSLPLSQLSHSLSPPSLSPSCHTRSPLPPSLPAVTLALPSLPLSQLSHSLSPPSLSPSCHTRSPLPPSLPAVTLILLFPPFLPSLAPGHTPMQSTPSPN